MPFLHNRTTHLGQEPSGGRSPRRTHPRPSRHWWVWLALAALLAIVGFFSLRATSTIRAVSVPKVIDWKEVMGRLPDAAFRPNDNEDRTDLLLLGIRGSQEEGGFLTDTIMVVSVDNDTGRSALISIPRDLYVPMPGQAGRHKINEAYEIGQLRYGNGLAYAKSVVAFVTGLHIDYAALVNLNAFHELVEITNGVTITLDQPFTEYRQWYCDEQGKNCMPFGIEAGTHHIQGQTLDFYIRSRFSSSDFDRARRQQQVLLALKKELFSLGVLTNPASVNDLLGVLGRNVQTDIAFSEINDVWDIAQKAQQHTPQRYVYDSSLQGLLTGTTIDAVFVLVPQNGTFAPLREKARILLDNDDHNE